MQRLQPPIWYTDSFYSIVNKLIDIYYPLKTISITSNDPYFVNPEIKHLLRTKNSLMRKGILLEAEKITIKIRNHIIAINSVSLKTLDFKLNNADLWTKVRQISGKSKADSRISIPSSITAHSLNTHYAAISTDSSYATSSQKLTASPSSSPILFSTFQIASFLDKVKPTSPGLDNIPHWFLKTVSHFIAEPIAHIFNLSMSTASIPTQWKQAIITPIAKVPNPTQCSDFRLISITPKISGYNIRKRAHNLELPIKENPHIEKNFFCRMLNTL